MGCFLDAGGSPGREGRVESRVGERGNVKKAIVLGLGFLVAACSSEADPPETPTPGTETVAVIPLAPLGDVKTTVDRTYSPKRAPQKASAGPNPSLPESLEGYVSQGFGELVEGKGEAYVTRKFASDAPPPAGPNAKRLVRFAHIPDLQLLDDESPTRLGNFDSPDLTDAALRPQDAYLCRMTNAAVRTINALHKKEPFAFTLLGGDNADSAQTNEVDWVLGILSGSERVKCDSGADDDPVKGPNNDGKDPFKADGLAMPWKWVTGNHDVLVQGNLGVGDVKRREALGTASSSGTRHYENGLNGAVTRDDVVADERRALLDRKALMSKLASHGDGHGLGAAEKESGRATYTFDVEGTPLRFLVIDTAADSGGADGLIRRSEIDRVIKPALDKAKAENKLVVLSSHHAQQNLTKNGGTFGTDVPDPVLPQDWTDFLGGYPNVVFSMVGHTHAHRVRPITTSGGRGYWEVMTSAIADFPHEFRVVEIFDQDNGFLMLRGTCVDFATDGDDVAAEGRKRGVIDLVSGWTPGGVGTADDRNVELWIKKP